MNPNNAKSKPGSPGNAGPRYPGYLKPSPTPIANREGYALAFVAAIEAITAAGQIPAMPAPIGNLGDQWESVTITTRTGATVAHVIFTTSAGEIWIGDHYGNLSQANRKLTEEFGPTFEDVLVTGGNPALGNYRISRSALSWVLPGGLKYDPENDDVIIDGSNDKSGIGIGTLVAAGAALFFLTQ